MIEGDGTQTRDFIYIDDVIEANIAAMNAGVKIDADVFNVASGDKVSLLRVKDMFESSFARELQVVFKDPRPGDIRHSRADIDKVKRIFDWLPKVGFEEGFITTVDWYQKKNRR